MPGCGPCCPPCGTPCYRYEDRGSPIKKLPLSAYKRNGLQDRVFSEYGSIRYLCQSSGPSCCPPPCCPSPCCPPPCCPSPCCPPMLCGGPYCPPCGRPC